MSRSFLTLCQAAVSDLGIAGGVLQSTQGLTSNELIRMCGWVARADIFVQNLWTDWNFLWFLDTGITVGAGLDYFTPSKTFNAVDQKSLVLNTGTTTTSYPQWMDWEKFYFTYQTRPKTTSPAPTNWSIDPSGKCWLSHYAQAATPAALQYWLQPAYMTADNSVSPIPNSFDSIIVERAKIFYAERENAPEILTGSTAEYMDLKEKIESSCLPRQGAMRKSNNDYTTAPNGYVE